MRIARILVKLRHARSGMRVCKSRMSPNSVGCVRGELSHMSCRKKGERLGLNAQCGCRLDHRGMHPVGRSCKSDLFTDACMCRRRMVRGCGGGEDAYFVCMLALTQGTDW